jgi:hypothetical protein
MSSIRKLFAITAIGLGLSAAAVADPTKPDPKTPPKGEPKPPVVLPHVPTPPVALPTPPKLPVVPEVKLPTVPVPTHDPKTATHTPDHHPLVIHEKPKGGPAEMPKGPGLKLPGGTKIDHAELAKIKPPIDLAKTKPEAVLASKPPADFKAKPMKLDHIHIPHDAPAVEKLGIKSVTNTTVNQTFIVNKNYYTGNDYYLKYGTKTSFGYYIYPGMWHTHWHHAIWDPVFATYYFFDPSTGLYYYWNTVEFAYYPCHWFVEYQSVYYPWWLAGGFPVYGYAVRPTFGIFIGW